MAEEYFGMLIPKGVHKNSDGEAAQCKPEYIKKKGMVSFISKGRYGNFLFVACAAYAYALKHGLGFHVQDKSLAPHQWKLYLQHLINPNWDSTLETVYVNDDKHTYTELPFKEEWRNKNIIIGTNDINTGYFQSYKYFEGYEEQIRQAFNFKPTLLKDFVSIHVRRGDYVNLNEHHPTVTLEYISEAIYKVRTVTKRRWKFIVFSDDIEWCKANFIKGVYDEGLSSHEFFYSENKTEQEDFLAMMSCQHNIVANSSFSVLAALLNPFRHLVVCPHENNYFGIKNKHLDVSTLYPDNWKRIKY